MKKSILLMLLIFFQNGYGQVTPIEKSSKLNNCLDTVYFKGYFVIAHNKVIIEDNARNVKFKQEKKAYRITGDSQIESFFFPFDSMPNNLLSKAIAKMLNHDKSWLYLLCDESKLSDLDYFICNDSLKKPYTVLCPPLRSDNYYVVKETENRVCYQIFELSGYWLKFKISTNTQKRILPSVVRLISPSLKEFNAYMMIKADSYNNKPIISDSRVQFWKNVPLTEDDR